MSNELPRAVGQPLPHESALAHVTGSASYIDDIALPGRCLHVATGYAPVARATLDELDLAAVREAPGVVDVVVAADVPGALDIGALFPGDTLLCDGEIHHHGQALFAVAATTHRQAQQAVLRAHWSLTPQPALLDLDSAIAADSLVLPARDWGQRDLQVEGTHHLRGALEIGGQEHFYLEGQACVAWPQDDGGVLVQSSTQHPDELQHVVARVLGCPLHRVTVQCQRMGGGFGGKESQAASLACLAALFAQRQQCAVKYRMPRHADMVQTGKRHPFRWAYHVAHDAQGMLQAADIQLFADCGHSPDLSGGIVERAMFHATNAYAIPKVRIRGHHQRLHHVSHTAFRGFGGPQGMLGIEAVMDEVAYQCGLDPLDVRLQNLYRAGADHTPYGQPVEQLLLAPMLQRLAVQCDYRERKRQLAEFNGRQAQLRKGLAITPVQFGIAFTATHLNQAGALVHLYRDGSVQVNHGGTEMGQGLHTKVRQVVADALGIAPEAVRHTPTSTDKVPNASPTAASSGTDLNAFAALEACATLKQRLHRFARAALDAPAHLVHAAGRVHGAGFSMSFAALVEAAYLARVPLSATGFYATPGLHFDKERGVGRPFYYFAHGAAASEVVIDVRTGEYRLLRVDVLHDVGRSVNPALDIGQIEGGYVQGLGWLTCEELAWDEAGLLASNSPANYKIPTADMTPAVFNVELFDAPNAAASVHRSKAVGEPPLMLAISAWCALRQAAAAAGHRLPQLRAPATPEAVLKAVQDAQH